MRRGQLTHTGWQHYIHHDDRHHFIAIANALQKEELPPPVRIRFVSATQRIIVVELRMLFRRAEDGSVRVVIGRLTRLRQEEHRARRSAA